MHVNYPIYDLIMYLGLNGRPINSFGILNDLAHNCVITGSNGVQGMWYAQ